jgi:hypothetical protein
MPVEKTEEYDGNQTVDKFFNSDVTSNCTGQRGTLSMSEYSLTNTLPAI